MNGFQLTFQKLKLMSDWKEVKLGDFFKVKHGYAFKGKFITKEPTKDVLVTPGNFHIGGGFKNSNNKYYSSDDYPDDYVLKTGDIVVTMTDLSKETDTLGFSAKIPEGQDGEKYLHNQRVGLVEFKNDNADADFLYWKMRTRGYQWYIVGSASGTSIMHTSPTRIEDFDFLIPPLAEQKAIASVLSSLDDKIDLLHRQNKTLEEMAETVFREWFVERADEDWEIGVFGDAIELFDNLRVPLSKMERNKRKEGKLYPYYGAAKIMDYINDYIFDGEYILLGEDGTVSTSEGYPILQYATGKFWVNNHTHVLKAQEPYSNFFIWNYLLKKNITKIITGAVQPKINQGNLKALDFPKFPEKLVLNFNNRTMPLLKRINQNNNKIKTLENLRDTLLPRLMSGEIRIPTDG